MSDTDPQAARETPHDYTCSDLRCVSMRHTGTHTYAEHIGCLFNHEHRFPECYDDVAARETRLAAAREYIEGAEADVPRGRTFEDWHNRSAVLLRDVLALRVERGETEHNHPQEVCEPCWKAGHDAAGVVTPDPAELEEQRILPRLLSDLSDLSDATAMTFDEQADWLRAALRAATPDDPTLDGTDGAHPAWWRGSDHGYAKGRAATSGPAEPRVCEVRHGIWTEPHDSHRCWESADRPAEPGLRLDPMCRGGTPDAGCDDEHCPGPHGRAAIEHTRKKRIDWKNVIVDEGDEAP